MYQDQLLDLLRRKKNFVFIGEAGSGKTETALSLAALMTGLTDRPVHLFDMDQTKPNFRARDAARAMERSGVRLHYHDQILDLPSVAPGVNEHLRDPAACVLMDVGGGSHGSHMIGQFHQALNREDSLVFYIVNPYRPWSKETENIRETMRRVLGSARLERISLMANPNLGAATTAEDVLHGMERLRALLDGVPVDFVCALEPLCGELSRTLTEPIIPIRLNTLPRWMLEQATQN